MSESQVKYRKIFLKIKTMKIMGRWSFMVEVPDGVCVNYIPQQQLV